MHLGQFEAAEPLLLAAHDQIARAQRPDDYRVQRTVEELVALYEAWHRPDDAALWRSRPAKQ